MGRNKDKQDETDYHHLNSWSNWGTNDPDNLYKMNRWKHEAYHKLFWWLDIIGALKNLLQMWWEAIAPSKAKDEIRDCLNNLDYKDSCKGGSRKKRR